MSYPFHTTSVLYLPFFMLLSFTGSAQETRVSGQITDENSIPVAYTPVLLVNAQDTSLAKGSITDSLGQFEINISDTGRFMVMAEVPGYEKFYSPVFVLDNNQQPYNTGKIKLVPANGSTLNEVTIVTRKKFIDLQAGKIVVTPDNSPIASGSTAFEVLKRSPGVSVDQNQNITLKGKTNVMVLIDDKPTYMTQDQLMNMLKNMPAAEIATMEIINNPSSKFDAAGNAGIINIKLKKAKNTGYNGSVYLGGGYGWYEKYYTGFNMNLRTKKLNVFGSYNYNHGINGNKNYLDRKMSNEGDTIVFSQNFNDKNIRDYHAYKAGIDFYATKKTTLGILLKGTGSPKTSITDNTTNVSGANNLGFDHLYALNTNKSAMNSFTGNVNLSHHFDSTGRKLNIDADYSAYQSDDDGVYETRYYNANQQEVFLPMRLRSGNFSDVIIYAGKIDYVHPLGKKTVLEGGLKSSYVNINNAIKFELDQNGTYVTDPGRSNDFEYTENINAAYASYNTTFKKGSLNIGLRTEQTANTGFSATLDSTVKRQYISLFPSASFSWDVDSTNNVTLAYSRRIDRPGYQDLNPFLYYADPYTFHRGNPFLRPQFTDGVSLTHGFMQFLFTTVGADLTHNFMSEIIEQDTATKITFMTSTNFKTFNNYYVSINAGAPIKQLFLMLNLTGFYNQFKTQYNQYQINNSKFTYNIYLSASYALKNNWKFELSGFYNSPAIYGIFRMSNMYQADAGIKKSFPKKGIEINLSASDLFNTMRNRSVMTDNGLRAVYTNKWESRKVNLTLTWNFGKRDLQVRKRKTATEDEQGRIKSK